MNPEIRIRQGKEKNLLRHHPWVFSGAIEESTAPAKSGICRVVTSEGRFIAWGIFDPDSHIILRLLSWDEAVFPDDNWWSDTVRASVLRRRSFFEDRAGQTTAFRIIHGEADMIPGVAADVYGK
ncbi:MAG: class I SAM-dependent rRNA methyltransferase, partial [Spirochaetales bacterium]|nr:class I SAM-dependent rRNA methyltransferase [Spirochaetales bacterium]